MPSFARSVSARANLFLGYWDDPEATRRALAPSPAAPFTGERVFKTGDLANFKKSGNFYFVGRNDDQIKIMGNRVELNEIVMTMPRMRWRSQRREPIPDTHSSCASCGLRSQP